MLSGQKVECIILTLLVHKRGDVYLNLSKISTKSIAFFRTLYLVPSMEYICQMCPLSAMKLSLGPL